MHKDVCIKNVKYCKEAILTNMGLLMVQVLMLQLFVSVQIFKQLLLSLWLLMIKKLLELGLQLIVKLAWGLLSELWQLLMLMLFVGVWLLSKSVVKLQEVLWKLGQLLNYLIVILRKLFQNNLQNTCLIYLKLYYRLLLDQKFKSYLGVQLLQKVK